MLFPVIGPVFHRIWHSCLIIVLLSYCSFCSAQGKHVRWINEIQTPPGAAGFQPFSLSGGWQVSGGQVITTRKQWEKSSKTGSLSPRQQIENRWLNFLGPLATQPRILPKLEILDTVEIGEILRIHIRYEVLPGDFVEAYILRPAHIKGKVPGVVVLHSTVNNSIDLPAGIAGRKEEYHGLGLAQRGMIAIVPRNYLWPTNDLIDALPMAQDFLKKYPASRGMARMLYDAQVAVDILIAMRDVDSSRIGAIGHSLGAKEVLYLAAFDKRIKASVFSEGGIGISFSNWNAPWYLGDTGSLKLPYTKSPTSDELALLTDHHELLALIAPRPFLLIAGDSADGARSWPYVQQASRVYGLYTTRPALGLYNHGTGHPLTPEAERRSYQWLLTYLNHRDIRN